nr:MAG TPA: hypothetical protein [Caudoviricetes sp.]
MITRSHLPFWISCSEATLVMKWVASLFLSHEIASL